MVSALKRPATQAAPRAAPPPKKPRADPIVGISAGIDMADGLPEGCRSMLSAGVPGCMLTPADKRHRLQEMVVKMLGDVLDGTQSKLQKAIEAGDDKVVVAEGVKDSRGAGVADAMASFAARAEEVAAKEKALQQTSEAVLDARSKVKEAQEAQAKGDAELAGAEASKRELEGILAQHFGVLRDQGEQEAGGAAGHIAAITPAAKQLGVDGTFIVAIAAALRKPPAERSGFDVGMIGEVETNFKKRVAELAALLAAGAAGAAERAAAVDAAQKRLGEATDERQRAATELSAARATHAEAAAAVQAAEEASSASALEYERAVRGRAEAAAELDSFLNYNMTCFTTLRDGGSAKAAGA